MTKQEIMNDAFNKQLGFSKYCDEKFPKLFENCIGNDTPPGWQPEVLKFVKNLTDAYSWVTIGQIKSKFGGLRIYLNNCHDKAKWDQFDILHEKIRDLEKRLSTVCEFTGKEGKTVNIGGWLYTVCPEVEEIFRNG